MQDSDIFKRCPLCNSDVCCSLSHRSTGPLLVAHRSHSIVITPSNLFIWDASSILYVFIFFENGFISKNWSPSVGTEGREDAPSLIQRRNSVLAQFRAFRIFSSHPLAFPCVLYVHSATFELPVHPFFFIFHQLACNGTSDVFNAVASLKICFLCLSHFPICNYVVSRIFVL